MAVHTLPTGLLRAAALAGAIAAFLLLAPSQARAADPLTDAADLVVEVTTPVVDAVEPAAEPVVQATQPVTDPVVEATQPITDPVVEATQPVTDPVLETTRPIVDGIIGRAYPIIDLPPTRPAPALISSPVATEEVTVRRAPPIDAERAALVLSGAPEPAPTELAPSLGAGPDTTGLFAVPGGREAVTSLTHDRSGSGSPLTNAGDALLIGMLAATIIGVAAGRQSLSFERLRLPSGLVLAPPVPPG